MNKLHPGNHKPRILSGMRPTGKLHLGHLIGALDLDKASDEFLGSLG